MESLRAPRLFMRTIVHWFEDGNLQKWGNLLRSLFHLSLQCPSSASLGSERWKKLVCRIGLEIFGRTKGKCVKYPRKILKFSTYKNNNKNKLSRKFRHLTNRWQCDNRAARAKFTVNSYFFFLLKTKKKPTLMTIVVQRFGQKCTFTFSKIFTFSSS